MAKLWQIVTAEPVSSRWSSLLGQCLCRHMCICGIPRKGIHKKEFVLHISCCQNRSTSFQLHTHCDIPLTIPSSLPLLIHWCVNCCHLSAGNSVKLHQQEKYRHVTVFLRPWGFLSEVRMFEHCSLLVQIVTTSTVCWGYWHRSCMWYHKHKLKVGSLKMAFLAFLALLASLASIQHSVYLFAPCNYKHESNTNSEGDPWLQQKCLWTILAKENLQNGFCLPQYGSMICFAVLIMVCFAVLIMVCFAVLIMICFAVLIMICFAVLIMICFAVLIMVCFAVLIMSWQLWCDIFLQQTYSFF